ncbi:MAG: DUF4372 domain-containing protein [Saprospiraceae bacterium]
MKNLEKVNVSDLFDLLPDSKIDEIADRYQVDKYVSKLKGKLMLKLMLYSQLSLNDISLRSIQEQYSSIFFQILVDEKGGNVSHGAIRDRLIKIPCAFFKDIYHHFYEQVAELYDDKTLEKYHLKRYDSTLVSTSAKLLGEDGLIAYGNTRAKNTLPKQVKYTTEMLGDILLNINIYTAQKYASEDHALGDTILSAVHKSEQVVIFDRGLKDRKAFVSLDNSEDKSKTLFVTRIKKTPKPLSLSLSLRHSN